MTNERDDLATTRDADPEEVEYMFAQTASGLDIDGDRVTLKGVSATTLFFSDRPERLTGHIPTEEFFESWGVGDDNFAVNPPNALLSIFEDDHVNDVVVVLREPELNGADMSYAVQVTDGELTPPTGPASLFIDMIGRPLSPVSVAGVRRRGSRRGMRRSRRRR